MSIYERPTKSLLADWARENLLDGQTFEKSQVIRWFSEHYPKIKSNTVGMHVEGMSVNNVVRKHHPNIKRGSSHDLFYKMGPNRFRLWVPTKDPAPLYKTDIEQQASEIMNNVMSEDDVEIEIATEGSREFAFERDLRNYLVRNISLIEPGLKVYEEEEITGVEFPVGGRFIDILAIDKKGSYVVIELKVSRGYDRVVGQILRYIGWVKQNMETSQPVRGIIVANEITSDLKLAASQLPNVQLIEYQISFKLLPVSSS